MDKKSNLQRLWKPGLKVLLSALALFIVFRKTGIEPLIDVLSKANLLWFIIALVFFNFSKILSSLRLNLFFKAIGLNLTEIFNLRLYYVGMFYNLFLPGGIGGDAYKLFYLKNKFDHSGKQLFHSIFLDRLTGLAGLIFLMLGMVVFSRHIFNQLPNWVSIVVVVATILVYPLLWLFLKVFYKKFLNVFWMTNLQGLLVQALQVVAAYFLLSSIGVTTAWIDYLILFLASSVITIIPFTIGGLGARELVFIIAAQWTMAIEELAVSLGLLFFIITAISSLSGVFIKIPPQKKA